jgi:riboflavin kinase/FMN adenylyltransferase
MDDMASGVTLKGTVTRFKGDGRRLGYPTANLTVDTSARDGVYFGWADLDGYERQPSIIFVGVPTTTGDDRRRVEAHLLDIPDKDYYDLTMSVTLAKYHRSNRTFADMDALMEAMNADEAAAREWFRQGDGV